MPVIRSLIAIHYPLYQTFIALLTAVTVLHILFEYNWFHASAYGAVTVGSYWLGQGIVALIQRYTRRGDARSSLD